MNLDRTQLIIFGSIGAVIILILLVALGIVPGLKKSTFQGSTIVFWDRDGTQDIYNQFIADFQSSHPGVAVTYVKKDPETYESDLLNALAAGNGPDVFILRDADLLKHKNKLVPLPQQALNYSSSQFQSDFVDGAFGLISPDGAIWGAPEFMDSLALLYNRDLFNSANIPQPPAVWEDFLSDSRKITQVSQLGSVTVAGAAMGGTNVADAGDILSALMMQSGAKVIDAKSQAVDFAQSRQVGDRTIAPGSAALSFFTSFVNPRMPYYSWSQILSESRDYFSQGKVGMLLGFASDVQYVLAKNPHLNLSIAPFPQPKNASAKINYGRYHFFAVSRLSTNPAAAWQFALAAAQSSGDQGLNAMRFTPPALRSLAGAHPPADWLSVFYQQSLSARTWMIPDADATRGIFSDMIANVLNGRTDVSGAVQEAASKLQNLLDATAGTK